MRILLSSLALILLSAAPASAAPTLELKSTPRGDTLPFSVPCPHSSPCKAELWARASLLARNTGIRRSADWVRVGRSHAQTNQLSLSPLGQKLLRAQPDGVPARLRFDSSASMRKIFLRFPRQISIPASRLFPSGQATVDKPQEVSQLEGSLPDPEELQSVTCVGHTASSGNAEESLRLAYRRALEVCKRLGAEDFKVISRGEAEPVASNLTPQGRALNRRVELEMRFTPSASRARPFLGVHSMLRPGMSQDQVEATMQAAQRAGLSMLRFDLALNYVGQYIHVYPGMYDFSFFDMVRQSALRNSIKLLPIATWSPQSITQCPDPEGYRCPPRRVEDWIELLSAAAARAPEIEHWEIWNEPNIFYWKGSVAQYAELLDASVATLHQVSPENKVLLGGPSGLDRQWLSDLLPRLEHKPDIVSLHIRPRLSRIQPNLSEARQLFDDLGFAEAPLWVTEFGYPSDAQLQPDPAFASGPLSQAEYYDQALPLLRKAGVDRVFITGRDAPEYPEGSPFRSEGLWDLDGQAPLFKPAYQLLVDNS